MALGHAGTRRGASVVDLHWRGTAETAIDTLRVKGSCYRPRGANSVKVTFRTAHLERCYRDSSEGTKEWGRKVARKYIQRVDTIKAAATAKDLAALQALRFHPLRGEYKGQHAISLDGAWRLHIAFEDKAMTEVRVEEVSKHYGD